MNKTSLKIILTTVCEELLKTRAAGAYVDSERWQRLVFCLARTGLSDKVEFVQWSKFPLLRTGLKLDPAVLLSSQTDFDYAVEVIVENLLPMLCRELSASSMIVLTRLNADYLERALEQLWTSQLTADRIAQLMILDAIKADLDAAIADKIHFGAGSHK